MFQSREDFITSNGFEVNSAEYGTNEALDLILLFGTSEDKMNVVLEHNLYGYEHFMCFEYDNKARYTVVKTFDDDRLLQLALTDPYYEVRIAITYHNKYLDTLINDEDIRVRQAVLDASVKFNNIQLLNILLQDKSEAIRVAAQHALSKYETN